MTIDQNGKETAPPVDVLFSMPEPSAAFLMASTPDETNQPIDVTQPRLTEIIDALRQKYTMD
jgi:hypothetical protein